MTIKNSDSNSISNKTPHYNTSDIQPAPTLNTSDVQMQTITPLNAYDSDTPDNINTTSVTNF